MLLVFGLFQLAHHLDYIAIVVFFNHLTYRVIVAINWKRYHSCTYPLHIWIVVGSSINDAVQLCVPRLLIILSCVMNEFFFSFCWFRLTTLLCLSFG